MPTGDDVESITSPEVAEKLTKKKSSWHILAIITHD